MREKDLPFDRTKHVCYTKNANSTCRSSMHDPAAPYDGYDESGDTEERARSVRLAKQIDYIH